MAISRMIVSRLSRIMDKLDVDKDEKVIKIKAFKESKSVKVEPFVCSDEMLDRLNIDPKIEDRRSLKNRMYFFEERVFCAKGDDIDLIPDFEDKYGVAFYADGKTEFMYIKSDVKKTGSDPNYHFIHNALVDDQHYLREEFFEELEEYLTFRKHRVFLLNYSAWDYVKKRLNIEDDSSVQHHVCNDDDVEMLSNDRALVFDGPFEDKLFRYSFEDKTNSLEICSVS